jgi:release factor glutamine methyltransferase
MQNTTIKDIISRSSIDKETSVELLCHLLDLSEKDLFLAYDRNLTTKEERDFEDMQQRVKLGRPVSYVTGKAYFYGRAFRVNNSVLIPRPETEILVKEALSSLMKLVKVKPDRKFKVVDIGTGSGNIIISIAKELERNKKLKDKVLFFGIDISQSALKVAIENAKTHLAEVEFVKADLLSAEQLPIKFDIVLANLPYLQTNYNQHLTRENRSINYEPRLALDGGKSGLDIIVRLIKSLSDRMHKDSIAILEVGEDQKNALLKNAQNFPNLSFSYNNDLAGKFRQVVIIKL